MVIFRNPWNILSFKKTDSWLWRAELKFSLVDSPVSSVECVLCSNIWVIFSKILFYLNVSDACFLFSLFLLFTVSCYHWALDTDSLHLLCLFATNRNLTVTTFQSYLCINNAVFLFPLPLSSSKISECHTENEIKARDPIRCRECGYRIMYKKRTKRCILLQVHLNACGKLWMETRGNRMEDSNNYVTILQSQKSIQ